MSFFQKLKDAIIPPQNTQQQSSAPQATAKPSAPAAASVPPAAAAAKSIDNAKFAKQCLKLAGGFANVTRVEACVTRVRLTVKDATIISDDKLMAIGAAAVVRVGDHILHVVVGEAASAIADIMKSIPTSEDLTSVEVPA